MYVIKSSLFNNHYFPVVRARRVIKSPFKLKGRTRSCVDNDGRFSFPFPNSQVSLFSTLEGEIRLVIPLQEKTSAHFGHLWPFNSVWTFQNNTLCIAKAGEGGPPLDDPVCPAPRVVALSAVCLQPPPPQNTSQEPLKMDPLLNEEDLQSAEEEEEVDPRIQVRISFSLGLKKKKKKWRWLMWEENSGYMGFKKK